MQQKIIISNNFTKSANSYDNFDHIQRISANYLKDLFIKNFPNIKPNQLFDLGCGTGNLTEEFYKAFPNGNYTLVDLSEAMLNKARSKFIGKDFLYLLQDIECFNILKHESSIAISNLCFQWLDSLEKTLNKLINEYNFIACSFLLDNSFKTWQERLNQYDMHDIIQKFPTYIEIENILNELSIKSFHFKVRNHVVNFSSPLNAMKYIRNLGANGFNQSKLKTSNLMKFIKNDKSNCSLNYEIAFLIIQT